VVEGRAFPIPRFALRPVESLEVPVQARAEVTDGQSAEQQAEPQQQDQHQVAHMMMQQQQEQQHQQQQQQQQQQAMQEEETRPHCKSNLNTFR